MQTKPDPKVTQEGTKAEIKLSSDITASSAPELRLLLKSLIADGVRELVIDIANVRVIDSSGIGLLVATYNSLTRLNGTLTIENASDELLELFKAFRLDRRMNVS